MAAMSGTFAMARFMSATPSLGGVQRLVGSRGETRSFSAFASTCLPGKLLVSPSSGGASISFTWKRSSPRAAPSPFAGFSSPSGGGAREAGGTDRRRPLAPISLRRNRACPSAVMKAGLMLMLTVDVASSAPIPQGCSGSSGSR